MSVLTTDAKSLSSALVVKQRYLRVYAYFIHKDFLNAKGNDTLCNYSINEKKKYRISITSIIDIYLLLAKLYFLSLKDTTKNIYKINVLLLLTTAS